MTNQVTLTGQIIPVPEYKQNELGSFFNFYLFVMTEENNRRNEIEIKCIAYDEEADFMNTIDQFQLVTIEGYLSYETLPNGIKRFIIKVKSVIL